MPNAYMQVRSWAGRKLGVSSGRVSRRELSVATHIYRVSAVMGRAVPVLWTVGKSSNEAIPRTPRILGPPGETSSGSIPFPSAAGEGHAVPGPVGDAEVPLRTFRHLFEKVGRRPVDKFHQEAVRERGDDLERQFVHDARANPHLRRVRIAGDSHCLGKT